MMTKNKILAIGVITLGICSQFSSVSALTNKESLLQDISKLEKNLWDFRVAKLQDIDTKLQALSKEYDDAVTTLWYDIRTLNYLVSLGKISTNSKNDLVNEFIAIKADITAKVTQELSTLGSLKDNVQYQYTTVSDAQKTILSSQIQKVDDAYKNLQSTFQLSITTTENKYKTNLATYKSTIKSAIENNASSLSVVRDFHTAYESLYSTKIDFDTKYNAFQESYLSFAGELSLFSQDTQKKYIEKLTSALYEIRDKNFEANPTLSSHKLDIDRLIDILIENFRNSLSSHIEQNYWVLHSDTDISSLNTRFNTLKNRYFDANSNVIAPEVLSNSGALTEVRFVRDKYTEINASLLTLLWDSTANNTFSNLKIRLENEMVRFYNANYTKYTDDVLLKLKEKLELTALENRNVLLAADSIDIRYKLFSDDIQKSRNLVYIQQQIQAFEKDMEKYSYLQSSAIDNKVKRLLNNSQIYLIDVELANVKFRKYDANVTKLNTQLQALFPQMEKKFSKTYIARLETFSKNIDILLKRKLSDKNRHMLLIVKKVVLQYLNTQYR